MPTSVTTPITDSATAVYTSMTTGLAAFFSFIPSLIGAIVVLLIGWFIASGIAGLVNKALRLVGFEFAMERSGVNNFVQATGTKWDTTKAISELSKWFVFLIFVQAAANVLNMPQITSIINNIILYIPNVIVAIVIMVAGIMLARFVASLIRGSLTEMGMGNTEFLAKLAQYVLIAFAAIAAVDQLGIAQTVVNSLLIGLVSALALGFGLAFGLGGRDVAARITQSWYERSMNLSGKIEQRALMQQNQERAQQAQGESTYMGPAPGNQPYPNANPTPHLQPPIMPSQTPPPPPPPYGNPPPQGPRP